MTDTEQAPRRPPTAEEARALGHPTRLRIVFACRERAMTNKELADALGTTPGTIHYHLRPLVETGFLRPETPRPGPRGSKEQPYRSTGKSWQIGGGAEPGILREVGAQEVLAASEEDLVLLTRLGVTLPADKLEDLLQRFQDLMDEAKQRSRDGVHRPEAPGDDDGGSVTIFLAVHRQPPQD
jgi:DNA-binding transcriptional ArsR family regulator